MRRRWKAAAPTMDGQQPTGVLYGVARDMAGEREARVGFWEGREGKGGTDVLLYVVCEVVGLEI